MKEITHTQAQRWLIMGQADLPAAENELLAAHLADCETCRVYARETLTLQQDLTRLLHGRWDGVRPTMTQPTSTKTTVRDNRLNFWGALLGASGLAILGFALLFFFNRAPAPNTAALIQPATVAELKPALYKTEAVTAVAFSQRAGSKVMAVGYRDGRIELVEAETGQSRFVTNVNTQVTVLAFASAGGGEVLASLTREGTVNLWAVDTTQSALTLMGAPMSQLNPAFFQLALSPDGARLAMLDGSGSVKVFNARPAPGEVPQLELQFDFLSEATLAGDLAFSPDGKLLAVALGTSATARVLNLETNQEAYTVTLPKDSQTLWVTFTPDGQQLVVGGNPNAYLFDLASTQPLATFVGNATWLTALTLSSDGKILATAADNDQTVRLWEAATGALLRELGPFPDPVRGLEFSADGSQLALLWYGADGAQLEIWSLSEATTPPLETPTPFPTPTALIAGPPNSTQEVSNLPTGVSDMAVIWSPLPQTTPLPPSGFTFGTELTYTSDRETIAHIVAFPLLAGEAIEPCEVRAMPEGRIFWADQTNFPPGTHLFSQNFPYAADAFPQAGYLVVRVNILDTAPVSNLLHCQQQVYQLEPALLTDVPFATWTPCPVGGRCFTITPPPTPTPCLDCSSSTPFPTFTPCLIGCPEGTATPFPTPTPGAPLAGCDEAWFFSPPPVNCPRRSTLGEYAFQAFERGYMVRVLNYEAQPVIYALYADGTWINFVDVWAEGISDSDPNLVPSGANLYAPRQGLGLVWSQNLAVREKLGWALSLEAETGFTTYQGEWRPEAPGVNVHTFFIVKMYLTGAEQVVHISGDVPPPNGTGQWEFWR